MPTILGTSSCHYILDSGIRLAPPCAALPRHSRGRKLKRLPWPLVGAIGDHSSAMAPRLGAQESAVRCAQRDLAPAHVHALRTCRRREREVANPGVA